MRSRGKIYYASEEYLILDADRDYSTFTGSTKEGIVTHLLTWNVKRFPLKIPSSLAHEPSYWMWSIPAHNQYLLMGGYSTISPQTTRNGTLYSGRMSTYQHLHDILHAKEWQRQPTELECNTSKLKGMRYWPGQLKWQGSGTRQWNPHTTCPDSSLSIIVNY